MKSTPKQLAYARVYGKGYNAAKRKAKSLDRTPQVAAAALALGAVLGALAVLFVK